jgi:phosphatidylserine/phosphatidylglycerophosphate/cardiolipin synthase-like enzyme
LTEGKIKERVLELLNGAGQGDRINLSMFYFSDRDVISALIKAKKRGCNVRVILDPNKDAFGRTKNGIPNRQTASKLVKAGIPVRWADTHGEQFHIKMLYVEHADRTAALTLGSCNFTRRNMDNFNAECNVVTTAQRDEAVMVGANEAFSRWWANPEGRTYTTDYATYEDPSLRRKLRAWLMETTGLSSF